MTSSVLLRSALDLLIFLMAVACTYAAQQADRPITAVLIFLTGVILIAFRSGLVSALIAAVAASFVYNFFLSEPTFKFGITSADAAVPLLAFNLAAILAGALVGRLKDAALKAYHAQSETAFLLTVSDRLQSALKLDDVETSIRGIIPHEGFKSVEIFLAKGDAYVRPSDDDNELDQLAPFFDDAVSNIEAGKPIILELIGARGALGLVKFRLVDTAINRQLLPNLKSVAALLSLAVERCLLLEEAAEAKVAAKSEILKDALLSSVSHDLRTPVTVIQAAAGALNSGQLTLSESDRQNFLTSILDQCARLDRYTSELLDVGQIQSGIGEEQIDVIDLAEITRLAMKHAKTAYPSLLFDQDFAPGSPLVRANGAMLEQAIYNVIDNAQKFGGEAGAIKIRLSCTRSHAKLTVVDGGPGIAARDQSQVFERFFKGGRSGSKIGMGLGLFIAKGFVEAFSGTITVQSPLGSSHGTEVTIELPLAQSADAAKAA